MGRAIKNDGTLTREVFRIMNLETALFSFLAINSLLFVFRRKLAAWLSNYVNSREASSLELFLWSGLKSPISDNARTLSALTLIFVVNISISGVILGVLLIIGFIGSHNL